MQQSDSGSSANEALPESLRLTPGKAVSRWGDSAQYVSEAATSAAPTAVLIGATTDPLGHLASLCGIYTGRVVRSLDEVTDEDRRTALEDMLKTELSGALESIQFHFLVENVTRSHTHQAVRTRQAFYAQESMRFAVVEDWGDRVADPPGFARWTGLQQEMWNTTVRDVAGAYEFLVNSGVPAEDARGLMPHNITTRYHVVLSLRTLLHEAGLRLCTQAQFEWRQVFAAMVNAIRNYRVPADSYLTFVDIWGEEATKDDWQFKLIADKLRPVCFQTGKCGFKASVDRSCKIRERVDAREAVNSPPSEWGEDKDLGSANEWHTGMPKFPWFKLTEEDRRRYNEGLAPRDPRNIIPAISTAEWALDPGAAR